MIHKFYLLDKYIVLDVNSGAVLSVDKQAYDLLDYVHDGDFSGDVPESALVELGLSAEDAQEIWDELAEMKEQGMLFSAEEEVDSDISSVMGFAPVKALCLHVAHDCNLRCKYCFASTGDFGTGRKLMDVETAKKAIDFVIRRSVSRKNIEVDFFGGEPLLAMNTVKETVEYAKTFPEKNFRFTITTNGVALDDETIEYINSEMSNVVLSLDGRREINDKLRPTPNGKGSFDIIVPKFKKLVENRATDKDYYVRGTFTKRNTDFASDVLKIAELGFDQISVEPVVLEDLQNEPNSDEYATVRKYALTEADLPAIFKQYDKLAEYMAENRDFNFFHFNIDLEQGPCIIKRLRGCGAGFEYVAVTPEGDIYPCHQFVGREEYRLGNVYYNEFNSDIATEFGRLNIYTREDCRNCWARYYCSGGCSAANLAANGSIDKAYKMGCDIEKKRLECAIALKITDSEGN